MVVVQFMSYVRHNVVSGLVAVCPCQQFVLENCHGTSVKSLIRKTGEARGRTHDPGLEGEQLNYYAAEASSNRYLIIRRSHRRYMK